MKHLFFNCTILTLLFVPVFGYAQVIKDIAGISQTFYTKNSFNNLSNTNKFEQNTFELWLPPPTIKIGKTTIYSNLYYRRINFDFEQKLISNPFIIDRIQDIKATAIFRTKLSNRLFLASILIPSLTSDFKNSVSSDDFIFDAIFSIGRKFGENKNFEIAVGPHVLYSFNQILFTPAITFDYKSSNNKWLAQFYWPRLNVLYNINHNTQIGLAGAIDWTLLNVENYRDIETNKIVNHAQLTSYRGGLQFNKRLHKNVWFGLQAGVSIGNSYTTFEKFDRKSGYVSLIEPKNDTIKNLKMENVFYARAMITYKLN